MRVLLAGGGSGGHVTPLHAISESLQSQSDNLSIKVVTDRGFVAQSRQIFQDQPDVRISKLFSGKYRRYTNKSFAWHIYHLPTFLKNIRDIFLLLLGTVQACFLFLFSRPDVVFCKGGFVCVPVGLAARLFRVPLIIHDSDTRPGLTNRILARSAKTIATGMPVSFYNYEKKHMVYTGIPVDKSFQPVSTAQQSAAKQSLGLSPTAPLLVVTGGGNGAKELNEQLNAAAPILLENGWSIVQLTGKNKSLRSTKQRDKLKISLQKQWLIDEFAPMVDRLLAADIVVCRTSASTIQECANAKKVVIGVPSPYLLDQKMNGDFLVSKNAIHMIEESAFLKDGGSLARAVKDLYDDKQTANQLAKNLHDTFAKPAAAEQLAKLILLA